MAGLAFIISIIALILAYLAYRQSGGATELRSKVEDIGISTDSLREKTADALTRLEKLVRGEQTKSEASPEQHQDEPSSKKGAGANK